MIEYFTDNGFLPENQEELSDWIQTVIEGEGKVYGDISYVFCNDDYLLKINQDFLQHDTYTDIISFDYSLGDQVHGEIYISTERVTENAKELDLEFIDELHRVMIHGILHYCGYSDGSDSDKNTMRMKESEALQLRTWK